jgi:hypothetical protein
MKTPTKPNATESARRFGCSVEQAKAMFAKNAQGFCQMAERAEKTGRKEYGYTLAELRQSEADYQEASK